ncbi:MULTISPECIES: anti-repressor SinI family protein [Metabacillus]|uniref:DNA-binding anti-repressor SinI n=1 Tax=Metabacillus elymi TaxID=2745198 RepID=A0ABX6S809_9BACI|nr:MULTISPECIES: anti-repressor SinI family protein [Metabacillus]QNF29902.1 DNA-binding anti-repressor SinI [Metabacillus sp. KUDC1714]
MLSSLVDENRLDKEWAELILYALELGLSPDEIREFLNKSTRPE